MFITLNIIIPYTDCRKCGRSRDNGVHLSLAECEKLKGTSCYRPSEHHRFKRSFPIKIERTW